MYKYALGALVFAGVLFVASRPDRLPRESLPVHAGGVTQAAQAVGGPCAKAKCLTVYVAPWCPACRQLGPTIAALRATLESEGIPVQVVVGKDAEPALVAYASTYERPVLLDAKGNFYKRAGMNVVPWFAVTNRHGEIEHRLYGGYDSVAVLREKLRI